MLHQTFEPRDLLVVLVLVALEGVLSIDNALVLGILARRLPPTARTKALTYGLAGALVFRLIAIALAAKLLQWHFVKLIGGGYLLYVAAKDLLAPKPPHRRRSAAPIAEAEADAAATSGGFWTTVGAIELTDIAFAIDSIVAAIALVGPAPQGHHGLHPKFWVVATGGMLGVVMMRFAAVLFIRLIERFPRLELSAYLLVGIIGLKLVLDWYFNAERQRLNFESPSSPAFWIFWAAMASCVMIGLLPNRKIHSGP
jgi:YkoY family integral membrane protein